jgi:hypothetical protein
MISVEQTIVSQYANSPTLARLVQDIDAWLDPSANIQAFYDLVWNVDTARGFGLDIWGRIVDVSRELELSITSGFFGFAEMGVGVTGFDEAPFYTDASSATSVYTLTDDAYRTLILVKAMANISATTAPSINRVLRQLFAGRGNAYVQDTGGMSMAYVFDFYLDAVELAIVQQSGALPRPAGVSVTISNSATNKTFGFAEQGAGVYPFDEGTYAT